MTPGMVVVAFTSVVALCNVALAQVEQRSNCRQPKLRDRAFCLSKIEDASAITELLDVAKQMRLERYPSKQDFVYASENAGLVAAKTKTDRLVLIVSKGDATAQRFGLIALRHTLSILRMGYAQGGERDKAHRAKIVGPTGTVCRERLAANDREVVDVAFGCLAETADTTHVPAIVKATLRHETHAQLAVAGVRALGELGGKLAELRPLVRLLENPLPDKWLVDDLSVRSETCRILARLVKETDRWVHLPAKVAAERIGTKSSQQREACEKLAAKTSGTAIATSDKPKPSGRDWFTQSSLERCTNRRLPILPQPISTQRARMGLDDKHCDPVDSGGGAVEVHLRVTGFDKTGVATAKALAIFGKPVKATPPPRGADYVTLEDMALDAKKAKGKIIVFRAFRSHAEPPTLYGCSIPKYEGDGGVVVQVRDADLALARQISSVAKECSAIRARVVRVGNYQTEWTVELLDVK
ncbi:MAG: hypothetical protein H0T42_02980 [Deltaproteobacteria bacterium]|nr:hypothetical protein [Deltaproteobacteria bacterium]